MARHLVRSLVLTAVLSPFVNAGPCRPSAPTSSSVVLATTTTASSVATDSATSSGSATLSGSFTLSGSTTQSGSSTETGITTSESGSSTATSLAATTTESSCSIEDHPDYTDPFTATYTVSEELTAITTTTEAATSTATAGFTCNDEHLKTPAPKGLMCAETGNPQGYSNGWDYVGSGPADSVMNCYQACMQTTNCQTFQFQENDYCNLYRGTITSMDDECSDWEYYDIDCFCDTDVTRAPTCEYNNPIINGGWDNGRFAPWQYDPDPGGYDPVDFRVVPGGQGGSGYRLQTGNFNADKSMWLYQDVEACPGARFDCTFYWWWDKYYAIRQNNGGSLVPYVRIYQDDEYYAQTSEYPRSDADAQRWIQGSFNFRVPPSGKTRIWYVASSPQGEWINTSDDPCKANWVHRPNALALDSMVCQPY